MTIHCVICGETFEVDDRLHPPRKYCTAACRREAGRRYQALYSLTPEGKAARRRYDQSAKRKALRRKPEHQAKHRAKQNRLFRTSQKYRDRHRNYSREYMRKYRENKRKRAVANNPAEVTPATGE